MAGVRNTFYGTVTIPGTPIQDLGITSRKIRRYEEGNWISFNSITSPENMLADLDPNQDFETPRPWHNTEGVASYRFHANNEKKNTPLLIIEPIVPKCDNENGDIIDLPQRLWAYYVYCPSEDGLNATNIIKRWKVGNINAAAEETEEE